MFRRSRVKRTMVVCAVGLGVSIGMCGLTALGSGFTRGQGLLVALGILESIAMLASFAGLVATSLIWLALYFSGKGDDETEPQTLFGKHEHDGH